MPKAVVNLTRISPFHNLSIGALVDQLGRAKAEAPEIKSREEVLRAELIARGITEAEGMLFRATVTEASRWTIDTECVKQEMGAAWYQARCRVGACVTERVSARIALQVAA